VERFGRKVDCAVGTGTVEEDALQRVSVDGVTLAYEVQGTGEPVAFIHGALIADTFRPLAAERSLTRGFRLISYHRRGYGDSSHVLGTVSVATHVADCLALLRHLGVERAHVVGHSFGGVIALQLALQAPEVAGSLALLEPALMLGASARPYRESLERGAQRYREVGAKGAVDEFLQARLPGYRSLLAQLLPEAFDQAVADAGTSFEAELPGLLDWRFGEQEARSVGQPTLVVIGEASSVLSLRFGEVHRLLLDWLPHAEEYVLPGATHFLQLENPRDMATALADFYARHPLGL
jgi:pimeloyl-ACP methyl ester carboxylesterase